MITDADEHDEHGDYGEDTDETWAAVAEEAENGEAVAEEEYFDEDYCEHEAELTEDTELLTALEEMGENSSSASDAPATLQESKKNAADLARARGFSRGTIDGFYKPGRPSARGPAGGRGWSGRGRKGKGGGKGARGRQGSPSSTIRPGTPRCDD